MKIQIGTVVSPKIAAEFGMNLDGPFLKSGNIRASYRNIPTEQGWADYFKFVPASYDLVTIRTREGKECPGWWSDSSWYGLRMRKGDKVIQWKIVSGGMD